MQSFEYAWQSADGVPFYGQGWMPEAPKAVVCLVHGLGEHSGRYAHMGKAYAGAGYALLGFDLRGHGKSGGVRGHAPSFEAFMQDIDRLLEEAGNRYPGLPRFIYGHSLGGILTLNYALRRKPDVKGVITSAAGLRTAIELQKGKVFLARVFGSVIPSVVIPSGLDPNTISRTPEVVQRYVSDPLVHDKLSFGMGKSVMGAIAWAFEHAPEFPAPLLVMHGTADQLGFASGSQEFASKVKGDCTFKAWEGLSHELHNEPEQAQVFEYTVAWMDAHL
ncbi:MAG: alpha/beta hydrolase [Chloroflexota bacterium]